MRTPKEIIGLGERIEKTRGNMTREDLASKANITYPALVKIENGEIKNPSAATVADIAFALNVGVEYLIGRKINHINEK